MSHRTIAFTYSTLATAICWLMGVGLVVGAAFGWLHLGMGLLGIMFVAFGHLVVLRRDHADLAEREREAFDLGRESVRSLR